MTEKTTYKLQISIYLLGDDSISGSGQEKESGKGMPFKNDLNSTRDRSGCEKGASCAAPLTVANERISP